MKLAIVIIVGFFFINNIVMLYWGVELIHIFPWRVIISVWVVGLIVTIVVLNIPVKKSFKKGSFQFNRDTFIKSFAYFVLMSLFGFYLVSAGLDLLVGPQYYKGECGVSYRLSRKGGTRYYLIMDPQGMNKEVRLRKADFNNLKGNFVGGNVKWECLKEVEMKYLPGLGWVINLE